MDDAKGIAELESAIEKSKLWRERLAEIGNGMKFPASTRSRVAVSLYHLCVEHHAGIHHLVDEGVWGSAGALLRPQIEAFVRGAWYATCATDEDIEHFLREDDPPRFDRLLRDLEASNEMFRGGMMSKMKQATWKQMCSLTHGGMLQVLARNTEEGVLHNREEIPRIIKLLNTSAMLSHAACVGTAIVAKSDVLETKWTRAFKEIYG